MPSLLPIQLGKVLYHLTEGKQSRELDVALTKFLQFVKQERMMRRLPYILKAFESYAQEKEDRQDITITTATPIGEKLVQKIAEVMSQNTIQVQQEVDPELLGGVTVKQGNIIIDASLKTQLDTLKRNLT